MEYLTPEQKKIISEAWYQFLLDTAEADYENGAEQGWYCFWGLYYLHFNPYEPPNIDVFAIQKKLPDEHWLKNVDAKTVKEINEIIIKDEHTDLFNPMHALLSRITDVTRVIPNVIDFSDFVFDKYIDFSNFIFPREVFFTNATFSHNAKFNNVMFLEGVNFGETTFSKETSFDKTMFLGGVNFYKAEFLGAVNFSNAVFHEIIGFRGTIFSSLAEFSNTTFAGHINFIDAHFKTHTPHFYNAKLTADITWRKSKWPRIDATTIPDLIDQNQTAYETLAYQMEKLGKYHDQHFFFRHEMRCRRELGSYFNSLIYRLYEKLADYGYGVGYAFRAWSLHIVAWTGILYLFVFYNKGFPEGLKCSVITSITNAHSFLLSKGAGMMNCYDPKETTFAFNLIWALESIFGAMFLFLVLLTLRVRFRLK